jgi:hypothetical protein
MMKKTTTTPANGATAPVNPSTAPVLDLDQFRLPQGFADAIGVMKVLTKISVKKPDRQSFVRVHPDPAYQLQTSLLEFKEEDRVREFYLVGPGALASCASEVVPMELHLAITRFGTPFIWPVRLPNPDGRDNEWHQSAREAVLQAQEAWVRMSSNMEARGYDVFKATANIPDPTWPDKPLNEILAIAFKGRIILTPDHDVLQRLAGEK